MRGWRWEVGVMASGGGGERGEGGEVLSGGRYVYVWVWGWFWLFAGWSPNSMY